MKIKNSFGLLGFQIENSLSPYIHSQFFNLLGIKESYSIFNVPPENFTDFFKKIHNLKGFNVTIPYKDKVFEKIQNKSSTAKSFKTTNTVTKTKNQFICHNTDYFGFSKSLEHFEVEIKNNALLLGLGGAGKIVAKKFLNSSSFLTIAVRKNSISKAKKTLDSIIPDKNIKNFEVVDINKIPKKIYNIIINATPIGMPHLNKMPIEKEFLFGCKTAIDLIYYPTQTKFLNMAKKLRIKTINGLFMLVAQAKKSDELFLEVNFKKDYIFLVYKKLKQFLKTK